MKQFKYYTDDLSEAATDKFDKEVKRISLMTDANNHIGAYIAGSKLIKDKKLENAFMAIATLQSIEGSLSSDLNRVRHSYYERMKKVAQKKLKPEEYKKFYGAF